LGKKPTLAGHCGRHIFTVCSPLDARGIAMERRAVDLGSVFMTKKTQAVRFPKSMRLPDGVKSVDIERRGRVRTITPSEQSWAAWFEGKDVSPTSLMSVSNPRDQARDAI
jgi:antitoxin VapB